MVELGIEYLESDSDIGSDYDMEIVEIEGNEQLQRRVRQRTDERKRRRPTTDLTPAQRNSHAEIQRQRREEDSRILLQPPPAPLTTAEEEEDSKVHDVKGSISQDFCMDPIRYHDNVNVYDQITFERMIRNRAHTPGETGEVLHHIMDNETTSVHRERYNAFVLRMQGELVPRTLLDPVSWEQRQLLAFPPYEEIREAEIEEFERLREEYLSRELQYAEVQFLSGAAQERKKMNERRQQLAQLL